MSLHWTGLATDVLVSAQNNSVTCIIAVGAGGLAIAASPGVAATPVIGVLHYIGFGAGGIIRGLHTSTTLVLLEALIRYRHCNGFSSSNYQQCSCAGSFCNTDECWGRRLWCYCYHWSSSMDGRDDGGISKGKGCLAERVCCSFWSAVCAPTVPG